MLLKFAVQEFIDDREFKNLSPVTIKTYQVTLKDFQEYCAQHETLDVDDISASTIKGYIMYCQKSGTIIPQHVTPNFTTSRFSLISFK